VVYKKNNPPDNFLGLEPGLSAYSTSRFIVLPVPYEATTSYGRGASRGPRAIIDASKHVEVFDEEKLFEPSNAGVNTKKPLRLKGCSEKRAQNVISGAVKGIAGDGKIPVLLGGEHTITPAAVSACKDLYSDLSVLVLDAHADLRSTYEGSLFSHACAVHRVLEICPAVQVGVRNISREEHSFARSSGQLGRIHFASEEISKKTIQKIVSQLGGRVYITVDVDCFDPAMIPSTGAPEPGGLRWKETLDLLKEVCLRKKVIGFDVVELSPIKGLHAPDFMVAKLIYKMMGYILKKSEARNPCLPPA